MMTSNGNQSKRLETFVQLGFSVEFEDEEHRRLAGHTQPLWRDWDGGQMGGRPSWLNPRDIPTEVLICGVCQDPLVFVCQLYAPCEEEINMDAFHRSFYVFACPHSGKASSSCGVATTGTVRVLRTQLPQQNDFYPKDLNDTDPCGKSWTRHLPQTWDVKLCQVCGQRGHGKCPIQGYQFCCKQHQREHKKYVFDKIEQKKEELSSKQQLSSFHFLPSVLAESELVVEEEPVDRKKEQASREKAERALFQAQGLEDEGNTGKKSNVKSEKDTDDDDEDQDDDEKLEQSDLNEMTGAGAETVTKDEVTMQFYDRVNKVPDVNTQCLRYLRWPDQDLGLETNTPLWMQSDYQPDDDESIPPQCENCGADRKFEFQLMPQMLHYLLKDLHAERAKQNVKKNNTAVTGDSDDDDAKTMEAIKTVTDIIEQAPPEQVPPELAATKERAVENMRKKIMDGHANDKEPGWGVVSIFTCTASCGSSHNTTTAADDDSIQRQQEVYAVDDSAAATALGAYIEEYAWRQPSLD